MFYAYHNDMFSGFSLFGVAVIYFRPRRQHGVAREYWSKAGLYISTRNHSWKVWTGK